MSKSKHKYIRFIIAISYILAVNFTAHAGEINATVKDVNGELIEDVVITAFPADPALLKSKVASNAIVDQINKEFVDHVTPVLVNTSISFPNKDNIRHHVYSFSPAKKFELKLYSGKPAAPVLFDKPGIVTIGCNIHDWMIGYIYVSETPYFAKTNHNGKATVVGLPAGEYSVRVWHPRLDGTEEATTNHVTITEASSTSLEWKLTLKPEFKIPRESANKSFDYH